MIMKGYYNLPDETADALTADGFSKPATSADDRRRRLSSTSPAAKKT